TKGMEEEFTWDDGTPVDYTNWMDLEPNNYDKDAQNVNHDPVPGQENCIHLRLSRQDDTEAKPLVGQWEQHVCQPDRYALALCKWTISPPKQGPNNGVTGATSGPVGPSKDRRDFGPGLRHHKILIQDRRAAALPTRMRHRKIQMLGRTVVPLL
ncbi:unnamed protein product, partial [Mesorhabditis spiculigera]